MSSAASSKISSTELTRGAAERIPASLLLAGVALVTCLVSLPRFHGLMLSANERDAAQALGVLSRGLASPGAEQADLAQLLSAPGPRHRLVDMRLAPDGLKAQYHGYRLALLHDELGPALLAWPLRPARSGRRAYFQRPGEACWSCNALNQAGPPPGLPKSRDRESLIASGWQQEP